MLLRGSLGLEEFPECDDLTNCCGAHAFYVDDHVNFYCVKCRRGQGHEYYRRNRNFRAVQPMVPDLAAKEGDQVKT